MKDFFELIAKILTIGVASTTILKECQTQIDKHNSSRYLKSGFSKIKRIPISLDKLKIERKFYCKSLIFFPFGWFLIICFYFYVLRSFILYSNKISNFDLFIDIIFCLELTVFILAGGYAIVNNIKFLYSTSNNKSLTRYLQINKYWLFKEIEIYAKEDYKALCDKCLKSMKAIKTRKIEYDFNDGVLEGLYKKKGYLKVNILHMKACYSCNHENKSVNQERDSLLATLEGSHDFQIIVTYEPFKREARPGETSFIINCFVNAYENVLVT